MQAVCYQWSYWLLRLQTHRLPSLRVETGQARAIFNKLGARHTDAVLIHGCPINSGHGKRYGHSWVECRDVGVAIDVQRGLESPVVLAIEEYHRLGEITPEVCRCYDVETAMEWLVTSEHYGPWEPHPVPVVDEPPPGGWKWLEPPAPRILPLKS